MVENKSKHCTGCKDDHYNCRLAKCCNLENAILVERIVIYSWQNPDYTWKPIIIYQCFDPVGGVCLSKDDPRVITEK